MTCPNENFPFPLLFGQVRALGFDSQPDEADLFVGWFVDKQKNFKSTTRPGISGPLDLNISTDQGFPLSSNQEAPPQQLFCSSREDEVHEGANDCAGGMVRTTIGFSIGVAKVE